MKTQLLHDLNDSGSEPTGPPRPASGLPAAEPDVSSPPAVWHRPQVAGAADPAPAPAPEAAATPAPAPAPAAAVPSTEHTAPRPSERLARQHAAAGIAGADTERQPTARRATPPAEARGFAPQPPEFAARRPRQAEPPDGAAASGDTTTPMWPPGAGAGTGGSDPDWLTERLARDAAVNSQSEWSGLWKRRVAAWGAAGVVLALLASGGLWLFQESRDEGALAVLANTKPAPAGTTVRPTVRPTVSPTVSPLPAALPSGAAVVAPPLAPAAALAPLAPAADTESSREVRSVDLSSAAKESSAAKDAQEEIQPPPKHQRRPARKQSAKSAVTEAKPASPAAREPSYRRRYEETMMQCRAHGVDERQCLQRGCEMTRFGFACKG
jgi:hypothetical protein